MVLLNAVHLPPGSVIGSPLARSAGSGGPRFPPAHSERHATQNLGSMCPLARCSARSNVQDVHKPSVGVRDGYLHVIVPRPPFHQVPYRSKCTMLLPPPPHSPVPVGRFRLGSCLPPPLRSLFVNIVPTVPAYGHPTLWRRQTAVVSSV